MFILGNPILDYVLYKKEQHSLQKALNNAVRDGNISKAQKILQEMDALNLKWALQWVVVH